jgi:hypothetical protein
MANDYQKPWHKQTHESGKNYHNFLHYLNLLPFERSMDRAYSMHQWVCLHKPRPVGDKPLMGCSGLWQELRFKHSWVERCDAYDMELAEVERLHKIQRIKEMNDRHIEFAMGLQTLGVERLKQYTAHTTAAIMTPNQLAALLEKASTVERRAMGEATQILAKQGDNPNDSLALDLSKLDETELAVFQSLVNKAKPGALPEAKPEPEVLPPVPMFAHSHKSH